MKPRTLFLFAVLATALSSSVHAAAYIKFDGIDGESRASGHEKWIEVTSVANLPAPDTTVTTREAGSGQATGRRQYQPLLIRKRIDKASPLLAKAQQGGTVFAALPASVDGRECVLTNARITKIETAGDVESISVSFEKIEFKPATRISNEGPAPQAQGAVPAGRSTPQGQGPQTPPTGAGGPP